MATVHFPPMSPLLVKRNEDDPCAAEAIGSYNMGLHVGAIFILIFISLLGSLTPLILSKLHRKDGGIRIPIFVFQFGRVFGGGTILATAFIHMMVPGLLSLTNPCLPKVWSEDYVAFGAFFAVLAILIMQFIQYLVVSNYHSKYPHISDHAHHGHAEIAGQTIVDATTNKSRPVVVCEASEVEKGHESIEHAGHVMTSPGVHSHTHPAHAHHPSLMLSSEEAVLHQKRSAVFFLEFGVAIHSIIIGLTVGVADDESLPALLIAIAFHQLFEGFALGATIVEARFKKSIVSWLLVLLYGFTTPIGVAIGIGLHQSYNENATAALLSQGILDSLAAGILLYMALVEIITPELTDNAQFRKLSSGRKAMLYGAFYLGVGVMCVLGIWA